MTTSSFRLIIALLTLTVAFSIVASWWAYRWMSDEPLGALPTPPCVYPPHYESLELPCSGADFSALPELPIVVYCDLVRNPELYDKQIVRLRAFYASDIRHSSWFSDPACEGEGTITDVTFGLSTPLAEESMRMIDETTSREELPQGKKVELLVIGRFYGVRKEGYGHLNGFPFAFSVMKVEAAKAAAAGVTPDVPHNKGLQRTRR